MESGSELSKTVATFILQKILLDETGLYYICQTYDRFSHVAMILGKMVIQLSKEPSQRLLKHVVSKIFLDAKHLYSWEEEESRQF